jgi:hypothetical protein
MDSRPFGTAFIPPGDRLVTPKLNKCAKPVTGNAIAFVAGRPENPGTELYRFFVAR